MATRNITGSTTGQIQQNSGGQTNNDLAQSRYDFRYLVFPNDLGMDNQGHYMVININVPTKFLSRTPAGQYRSQFTELGENERSKVDTLRGYSGILPFSVGSNGGSAAAGGLPRQTRRIAESIAMFMPTPLVFNTQNMYEEISLTALGGKLGVGAIAAASGLVKALTAGVESGINAARVARRILTPLGQGIGTAAAISQNPINPAVEILFTTTPVRQFTFELLMAPRNEKESETIKAIVKTLRFHAAPEINTSTFGLTWIPPAEFDITFFNKGVENMNILRINTCVLERIEVDYAPTSGVYSTFRNGHPVAVRLSLGFRELEPVHKQRVLQGF